MFRGHKSREHWEVSAEIDNKERLHNAKIEIMKNYNPIIKRTQKMLEILPDKTEGGVRYTKDRVREVMKNDEQP